MNSSHSTPHHCTFHLCMLFSSSFFYKTTSLQPENYFSLIYRLSVTYLLKQIWLNITSKNHFFFSHPLTKIYNTEFALTCGMHQLLIQIYNRYISIPSMLSVSEPNCTDLPYNEFCFSTTGGYMLVTDIELHSKIN